MDFVLAANYLEENTITTGTTMAAKTLVVCKRVNTRHSTGRVQASAPTVKIAGILKTFAEMSLE